MNNQQTTLTGDTIFGKGYFEPKAYFFQCFGEIPCITWVSKIDAENAFKFLKEKYKDLIEAIYQSAEYNRKKQKTLFSTTLWRG